MYKRILVATSDQSWVNTPVAYAIALAADTGAELSILTVLIPPIVAGMPDMATCSAMVLESVVGQCQEVLGYAAAAAEAAGVSYSTQVRWGNVPEMILKSAAEDDCDLIILGARHSTWRQRRLHDYTTRQVSKRARQPVLLVSDVPPPTYGVPLWSSLLVVRDSSASGEAAEEYAYSLAQEIFLEVSVLHIEALQERMDDAYFNIVAMLDQPCHWPRAMAANEMLADGWSAASQVTSSLLETVTSTACDVIVLGVHQDTGWKRWLRRQPARVVLSTTRRPVLLVNELTADGQE